MAEKTVSVNFTPTELRLIKALLDDSANEANTGHHKRIDLNLFPGTHIHFKVGLELDKLVVAKATDQLVKDLALALTTAEFSLTIEQLRAAWVKVGADWHL